ncbi:aldehyde dehydrogenase family protein [Leisingera daeponensis]|uniref:aldehyde dehydrogenase (NAD(+)) n=1 Tax=Leisingera daeponensis TaxID=405746 RepID=A0ABS7NEM6_9RHOB|nr:aldehyde dehydrogenase family protein [Leisingera daeponensis]MBY6139316.1 aldehyde dehydrogenase family protein [Leisingera daeponensis]
MIEKTDLYIDGAWVAAGDVPLAEVTDAGTGETFATVPLADAAMADRAAEAAARAFPAWAALPPAERAAHITRLREALKARHEALVELISRETGMPRKLTGMIQVGGPLAAWKFYAALAAEPQVPEVIGNSRVYREPVGPVACITPWNYPLHQVTSKVAAALAAGATMVLKPSEVAPLSAFALAEAAEEAGLPAGVFNLVTGTGPEVGEALVRHPAIAAVSFTGSTAAGKRVAALAAEGVKRVSLELGGKSAAVVLEGADLAAAVKATLGSCLLNSGQTCNAMTRLIVPEARLDEVAELLRTGLSKFTLGAPDDPATRLGPLASAEQKTRVSAMIARAEAAGVPVIARGEDAGDRPGFFVTPVVFGPVPEDAETAREEVFGPVLSVLVHRGTEDALRIANDTAYGLAAAVWAADDAAAEDAARGIRAGQIDLNGAPFNLRAPFGGFGQSGIGRENGPYGLEEFQELKSVQYKEV